MMTRGARDERGSMAVEVIFLVPVLMMFAMLVVAGGRYVSVEGDIEAASRDAARAASLESSWAAAQQVANRVVAGSLDDDTRCRGVDLGQSDWQAGGEVVVRLHCDVSYSGLGLIGLPGSVDLDAESAVPLDPYRRLE